MLETLREEDEYRHIRARDLADGRRRGHGRHDGEADHPVTQDRLDEHGDEAGIAERLVAGGLGFGDGDDLGGDTGRRSGAEIGQRDRQQRPVNDAADQIAEKHPAPIGAYRLGVGVAFDPRERQQAEAAGDEIEAEQHDEDEADRKDERAD